MNHQRIAAVALAALVSTPVLHAAAPAAPPAPQKVAEAEGITEYRLANGLRVLLFPDASKPTITVNITYLVGSRHESYGESGMAHLLEHLLFKGTPAHPAIDKDFNGRGMRFNGTTSLDRTNYYEQFQASDDNLDWALAMEADRMIHAFIAQKDLDTEMTVVRNEFERGENAPGGVLVKRLQSIAYDWHNYGNSTIGNRSDIENVEIANLQAFYRRYYQPDNAVLLVAGKFDLAATLQKVNRHFGVIPKPARALPKLWTVEPTQDGERSFTVRRSGDVQLVAVAYKTPSALLPDAQALRYANFALTDTPSGRLEKALVQTGMATQVQGSALSGVDGSLQIVLAVVKKGDPVAPVLAEMTRQIEGLATNPPTAEEMERARLRFANAAERTLTDHENLGLQLSEFIALGDWRMFFLNRDRAQAMTAADVQSAAGKYFRRDNRTVGTFIPDDNPQRAELPRVASAAEMLKDYKPKAAVMEAEAFDPTPDNLDARTKHVDVDGIKVSMLHKQNRGETVNVSLSLPGGDEKTLFGQRAAAGLSAQMLMRGTSRYTREQLRDEFSKLKVNGGPNGQGANFNTTAPNVAAAIRLAAHVVRKPSFPEAEFTQLKKATVTAIESQLSDPATQAAQLLAQHFNTYPKGDPRYTPSLVEQMNEVSATSLEDLKRYHKSFYGAERMQIAVVGEFDEAEVLAAIRESFGGWRSGAPYARITRQSGDIAPLNQSIETPDKENAVFLARLNLDMNESDADFPAMILANWILGGGAAFDSRLTQRIRVKDGLSYSVGSGLSVGRYDRYGAWSVQAIAAPQNIARVESAFNEELARFLKDGVSADELAKARSGYAQQSAQARAQDQRIVAELLSDLDSGRSFAWDKQLDARIQAVTAEALLAAARKHLVPARFTIVKAGDFAKVAKAP